MYKVVCDRSNNPDDAIANKEVRIDLYFTPNPSVEKINLTLAEVYKGIIEALTKRLSPKLPDCTTCSNRGKPYELSGETFCDHCSHAVIYSKQDHYKPI